MTSGDSFSEVFACPEVILLSADIERTAAFYRRLGFTETFRVPQHGAPIHVDIKLDGYKIGFASIDSGRRDHGLDPVTSSRRPTLTRGPAYRSGVPHFDAGERARIGRAQLSS